MKQNTWFRGYTSKTEKRNYVWITSEEEHAKQYCEINKFSYGGEPIVDEFEFNENNYRLLDLYLYDVDEMVDEDDIESFLSDVNVEYDYEDLFDIIEDKIPLSRLINKILEPLTSNHYGFKIMENGIKTIYINRHLL